MLKTFHQFPFIRFLLFFILGILFQSYWDIYFYSIYLFILAVLCLILAYIPFINRQYDLRFLFGFGFSLFLFAMAIFITKLSYSQSDWNIDSAMHLYKGRVMDEIVLKPKTYLCKIEIVAAEKSIHKEIIHKKGVIYLPIDSCSKSIVPGNHLFFYSELEDAAPYLKKQSIAAMGFVKKENWMLDKKEKPYSNIQIKALFARRTMLSRLQKIISNQEAYSIATALMFGYKNEMDKNLRQSFANIGAGHVLAVSGLHFSIVFGMIYFLFSFLGNSPRSKFIKQIILQPLIWGFAFITGFSPSVIRAAIMLSIWGIGDAFFYKSFTINTVTIAAFLMLLYNPVYLFDVGFQLSFTAVLSIVLINPHIIHLYETRNPILKYIWDLCCVSISAQIGVLPISIYYFHQLPLLFLLTNLLIIPLVTLLLFLIPVSLLFDFLCGGVDFLFYPLNKTLDLLLWIVKSLDEIPHGTLESIRINLGELFFIFLMILFGLLLLFKKRIVYFYLLLIFAVFQVFYYLC